MTVYSRLHDPTRMCTKCGRVLPFSDFRLGMNRYGKPQRRTACRSCERKVALRQKVEVDEDTRIRIEEYKTARSAYHQEIKANKKREQHLLRKYGITSVQYAELLAAQGGVCAICRRPYPNAVKTKMNVDHCHKTGAVRGLLCDSCNSGLGFFRDDIDLMLRAISYVSQTSLCQEETQ